MSEAAINARAKAREKVERLTRTPKGDVDASGWREPLGEQGLQSGVQTGPRPVSRRQFKRGGKVAGEKAKMHAGRKPRASGGGGWKAGVAGYTESTGSKKEWHPPWYRNRSTKSKELDPNNWTKPSPNKAPEMTAARKERASGGGNDSAGAYRDPMSSFDEAIKSGRLSADEKHPKYAGNYMYMGHDKAGKAQFKHSNTREYLKASGGRAGRASGGMTATDYVNRNVKDANDSREGPKHLGGMKKGGRAGKDKGGPVYDSKGNEIKKSTNWDLVKTGAKELAGAMFESGAGAKAAQASKDSVDKAQSVADSQSGGMKKGGKVDHDKSCKCAKCGGGAVGKARGGRSEFKANRQMAASRPNKYDEPEEGNLEKMQRLQGTAFERMHPRMAEAGFKPGRDGKATGGPVSYGGSRPQGGRIARAKGGRAKKGMNVNIIIAPSGPHPGGLAGGAPPGPPGGPVGMHQGMPPPPPMMPPTGSAPPVGGPPPQMRASGGRAQYENKTGGAGGLARLAKTRAYGETPIHGASPKPVGAPSPRPKRDHAIGAASPKLRASGGRTYEGGAGGGKGRLEKAAAYGP